MSYVDLIMDSLKEKEYVILEEPKKALITMGKEGSMANNTYLGHCVKFKLRDHPLAKIFTLFIVDKKGIDKFHCGYSILGIRDLPPVMWFKESDDTLTILEGLYI